MRIVYAGNRDISVRVLEYLNARNIKPSALLIPGEEIGSHNRELLNLCGDLTDDSIFLGREFTKPESVNFLQKLSPDYIISIHFPYLFPESILAIPKHGTLNLHPAYLPYNRGWHTPSWAILDDTPIGGTLHFMSEGVDQGDIVHQKSIGVQPSDTADTLYARIKDVELEVFLEAWPRIENGSYQRVRQDLNLGNSHQKNDLLSEEIQKIDMDGSVRAGDLIRKLRALTTNDIKEAAYFMAGDKKYSVQIKIQEGPHE